MKRALLAALLLTAAILLVFGGAIGNEFVYDDHAMVERNQIIRTLAPAMHLQGDFWSGRETSFAYFRPLVTWSLAWNYLLHADQPAGYHFTNLLFHACCSLLLFLILWKFDRPAVAWLGAAIFALHPVQTEAVVWVVGRTDLLATMFLLLATLLHARLPDRPALRDLPAIALVLSAVSAALLSKETAVTFPALAFGLDLGLYRARGLGWRDAWRALRVRLYRFGTLYVLLIAAYLLVRFMVVGALIETDHLEGATGFNPLLEASAGSRLLTAVNIFGRYAGLLLLPVRLSVDYMVDVVPVVGSVASPSFLLPLLVMLLLLAAALFFALRSPAALFGLLAAAGSYLLVSNVVFASPVVMAERMMNLPMAGIAALIAAGLCFLVERAIPDGRRRVALIALFLIVLAPLAARSYFRTSDWKDDFTLFSAAVRATPRSAQSWHNLGYQQLRREEYAPALESIERALELHPTYLQPRLNRLGILRRTGYLAEAEESARQVLAGFPQSGAAQLELIRILTLRAGKLESRGEAAAGQLLREEAVALARAASAAATERGSPGARAVILQAAAENLALLGRSAEAERAFLAAIAAAEEESGAVGEATAGVRAVAHAAAAGFFRDSGRPWEAAEQFAAAADEAELAGQPETASRFLLGAAESASSAGRPQEALALYDRLLEIDAESERARHGRARTRLTTGDVAGAEEDLLLLLAGEPSGKKAAAIWTDLAFVSVMREELEETLDRLGHALEADPGYARALQLRESSMNPKTDPDPE